MSREQELSRAAERYKAMLKEIKSHLQEITGSWRGQILHHLLQLWPFISYKYWNNPIYRMYNPIYNQL